MGYYELILQKKKNANECERHNVFQEHQAKLAVINTFSSHLTSCILINSKVRTCSHPTKRFFDKVRRGHVWESL